MKRRKVKNEVPTARGNEIVLASDPFGAFWRPLNLLASIAGDGDGRREIKSSKADGMVLQQASAPPAPYQMNGSTAVIPIIGPLTKYPNFWDSMCGWAFTLDIQAAIAKALDDGAVEKIILLIDSPGGMVAGTPDLGDFIARSKLQKPIVAYVSDLCASGAYWLASQCSGIVANPSAFIGSIGVYNILVDQSKAAEQCGVSLVLVSDGEFKGLTEPGLPVGDKAVAETQRIVGSIANLFRAAVGQGRNLEPDVVLQLADGRVHVASEALSLGLIDAIGTLDAAFNFEGIMSTAVTGGATGANAGGKQAITKTKTASDGTDGASGGDSSTPDVAEMCGKILDAINAQTEMLKKLVPADDKGADAPSSDSGNADDAAAKGKATAASEQTRMKAISAACPGRAEFATQQFILGKSAMEAKAALADLLTTELSAAHKKNAAMEDGTNPIAGVQPQGSGATGAEGDPEQLWSKNEVALKKAFGTKAGFLAAVKHTPLIVQQVFKSIAA